MADDLYFLDAALFELLMNAKAVHGGTARAREAGVSRATYYRAMGGKPIKRLDVAMGFARAAGVSVHKLFEGHATTARAPKRGE